MGELKNKTVKGVAWSAVERFSVKGVQFVLGVVLARLLSPSDYGLIAMLTVFSSISFVFIDGGFASALIQCKNREEEDYSTVFFINLSLSILFYLLLFICAPYIALFYRQPELELISRVYMLNLIINSFVSINRVRVTITLDFKTQAKVTTLAAFISGVVGIISAFCGLGVWALVIQMLTNAVCNWLFFAWFVRWFPKLQFSKKSFHKLFKFGSKLLLAKLVDKLYNNLNTLVIGKVFSPAELGLFNRGHRFADFANTNIAAVLNRVAFPVLSTIQDDNKRLLGAYRQYIKLATFVIFPLMMGMCGAAKPFVLFLLTDKWADSIILMQILCVAYMFSCVTIVNLDLLYVKGRSDLVLRLEIVKKFIAISILLFSLQYGLVAICLGRLCYSFIALFLNTIYTKRLLNYGLFQQIRDFLPQLIMSAVLTCEGLAISSFISTSWLALLLCAIVYFVSYIGMSKAINHPCLYEFIKIVKKK